MKAEFEIEKDGIKEKYIYCMEKMTGWQVLMATAHFNYSENMLDIIVQSKDEKAKVMQKQSEFEGYELLLMKLNKDNEIINNTSEKYHTKGVMDYLTGADMLKLEECKNDFFTKRGIISHASKQQMKQLIGLLPEGSSMSDVIASIMNIAKDFTKK